MCHNFNFINFNYFHLILQYFSLLLILLDFIFIQDFFNLIFF
jgi:hypothetical protein